MGNNNSQHTSHAPVEVVRRPPARPTEPPSARLVSSLGPQGPSYHSPENLVLPKELPTEFKLRPVSMELSKYNPDFENMYSYNDMNGYGGENNNEKVNEILPDYHGQSPPRPPPPIQNGHIPGSAPQDTSGENNKPVANNVKPGNHVPYRPSHRRQMSLTNNLTGHTILEEPEEDIDSRIKLDPLMQSFPGCTGPSLPVKNTSNLDYSYQLTYAQLAEARRNKTLENLEKRTGKKLSDLSADLSEHSDKPAFERGAAVRSSSKSLGSAISTKKKKAPTPPGVAPPPAPSSVSLPNSPRSPPTSRFNSPYSIDNEPPADYDFESPRRKTSANTKRPMSENNPILPRYSPHGLVSSVKPILKTSTPPVPPPPPGSAPKKAVNLSRNNSLSSGKPELILKKTPSVQSPKPKTPEVEDGAIPWLLEIKSKSEARAARQQSQESLNSSDRHSLVDVRKLTDEEKNAIDIIDKILSPTNSEEEKPISDKEQQEPQNTEKESNTKTLERSNSLKDVGKPPSPKLQRHFSTTAYDRLSSSSPVMQRQSSTPSVNTPDPVRRLSSLLQHDIKAAASAKCTKLVKQTTPVKPKPKDPHTVFREQLQKACAARDERVKVEGTIDDNLQKDTDKVGRIVDEDEEDDNVSVGVKSSTTDKDSERDTSSISSREPPDVLPKPPRYHKNVTLNKQAANFNNKPRHIKTLANEANKSKKPISAQSLDWAPEDDLDSDDNLSDREQLTGRKIDSDGFKSTIIPSNVNDLKIKKKGKQKKVKDLDIAEDQGKSKMGSVKKFKKSMHKSVKNAFGSISKASGKILRRQRAEDFEVVEDAPKNWKFSNDKPRMTNGDDLNRNSSINGYSYYHEDNEDDTDSDEGRNLDDIDFSAPMFRQNGEVHSDEESHEEEDLNSSQTIKRAGVAYVNPDGKLVVIPDSTADSSKEEKMARKVAKQKEMEKAYEASLKRKEKSSKAARVSQEIREREKRQEEEKRRQLELELELTKMKEAETRERLQRLENAHLQQQINAQLIQQQQQQNMSMLSAPPLPSSGPYQTPIPTTPQTQAFTTNIFGQQVPQNAYSSSYGLYQQNQPVLQNNGPFDLNDYMRVLGIQNPPTTQQMAFFLNNMSLGGQQFDIGSSPNLFSMVNQDPIKPFPNGMNGMLGYQTMDTGVKKQHFQTWASSPNINHTSSNVNTNNTSLPLADFVTDYNGASAKDSEKDNKNSKGRNPLYNSDDSDEGLSPQKTVECGRVEEYRTLPVRTESGKFMKTYSEEKTRTLPIRTESGRFMKQYGGDYSKDKTDQNVGYHHVVRMGSNSVTDLNVGDFSHQQRSVSPTNSSSTIDSAITSAGSTLSTPPSPSKQQDTPVSPLSTAKLPAGSGFRTVLDLTSPSCTARIYTDEEFQNGH